MIMFKFPFCFLRSIANERKIPHLLEKFQNGSNVISMAGLAAVYVGSRDGRCVREETGNIPLCVLLRATGGLGGVFVLDGMEMR